MSTAMGTLFAMGGYAGYVWSAFGVTLFAIIVMYGYARRRLHKALAEQRRLQREKS